MEHIVMSWSRCYPKGQQDRTYKSARGDALWIMAKSFLTHHVVPICVLPHKSLQRRCWSMEHPPSYKSPDISLMLWVDLILLNCAGLKLNCIRLGTILRSALWTSTAIVFLGTIFGALQREQASICLGLPITGTSLVQFYFCTYTLHHHH